MKKIKNINISKVERYYIEKLNSLKAKIDESGEAIKHYQKFIVDPWFEYYKKVKGDSEKESLAYNEISRVMDILKADKQHRKELIDEYNELKKLYKTIKRAFEERWLNGFADGVKFAMESIDKDEEVR